MLLSSVVYAVCWVLLVISVLTRPWPLLWDGVVGAATRFWPPSISDSQGVLLAAIITAAAGVLGNWATKSRDFRERRADRLADSAVAFYEHEATLFRLIDSGALVSTDESQRKLDEWVPAVQAMLSEVTLTRWDSKKSVDEVNKLMEELKVLAQTPPVDLDAARGWLDDHDLALQQYRMHAPAALGTSAYRLTSTLLSFWDDPGNPNARRVAKKELGQFLRHTMSHVSSMRRALPWRIAMRIYESIREWRLSFAHGWRAVFTTPKPNRVEGQELEDKV